MVIDINTIQNGNDFSKTIGIIDKSCRYIRNNLNLIKSEAFNRHNGLSNQTIVVDFNKSLDNLSIIFDKTQLFSDEFHFIMSLQGMSQFIFTYDNFTRDNFDFLLKATDQFIEIIEFKINNLSMNGLNNDVSREFFKLEKFFYTEIFRTNVSHDKEFFEDMIKLLSKNADGFF